MELSIEYMFMGARSDAVRWYIFNCDIENLDIERARDLFRQECPGINYSWCMDVGIPEPVEPIEIDSDVGVDDETVLFTKNDTRINDFNSIEDMDESYHNIADLNLVMDMSLDYDLELIPLTPEPKFISSVRRHSC